MRMHTRKQHEESKYKCNFCQFQSEVLLKIYELRDVFHPDTPIEFTPKTPNVKDMVLNLLAEQNIEMMEELLGFKSGMSGALEHLKNEILDNMKDIVVKAVNDAIQDAKQKAFENPLTSPSTSTAKPIPPAPTSSHSTSSANPKPTSPGSGPKPTPTRNQNNPSKEPKPTQKKRKTKYLQKPKVLYVGDSVAHNANFAIIEKDTNSRIKTVKAYSSVEDTKARWPKKNLTDVTQNALKDTNEEDKYSYLVVAAPTATIYLLLHTMLFKTTLS